MKEIQLTQYIAEDGKAFNNKEECLKYEDKVLTHRNLINQFDVYDKNLDKLKKPKYLWASTFDKFQREIEQDPIFKDFEWFFIAESSSYIVIKDKQCFPTIQKCLRVLGNWYGVDLDLPDYSGEIYIFCYNYIDEKWESFDKSLQEAKKNIKSI